MVAAVNQDFVTYQGDDVQPQFTVYSDAQNKTIVDISSVANIIWKAQRNTEAGTVVAVTKTMQLGQVTFVTNGTDGKFQVLITKTDTAALDGYYIHVAQLVDNFGNVTTCTVGRMQVGLHPTWTFDSTQLATVPLYQVRDLVGDTLIGDQQLADAQIDQSIASFSNIYLAASDCCRKIAARYAREVDQVQGELRTLYSQRQKNYMSQARSYQDIGLQRGGAMPYAGGISISDKTSRVLDTDRVVPQFNLGEWDNLLPISPIGPQTPTQGSPDFEPTGQFPV